jgi:hypothetical protein
MAQLNLASISVPRECAIMNIWPSRLEILLTHSIEGIGIALDLKGNRMFITDLGGSIYSAKLDGSDKKILLAAQGNLSGIAYYEGS